MISIFFFGNHHSLSSIETQMSYGPPTVSHLEDSAGNPVDSIGTRGSDLVVLVGTNFPNDQHELDAVRFGNAQNGYQTYTVVAGTVDLTDAAAATPGTCQVVLDTNTPSQIRCLTAPGVLRGHRWIVTVSGQVSPPGALTHYYAPVVDSVEVETVSERMNVVPAELGLFPTKGSTALLHGTHFGITSNGQVVPGTVLHVVLHRRGDLNNVVVQAVDVLAPNPNSPTKDQLRFTMPVDYGRQWTLSVSIAQTTGAATVYAPFPALGGANRTKFGYQPPSILHTDTQNIANNNLLLELIGENFCQNQACGDVYICQTLPGVTDGDTLCFAGGDKANGPNANATKVNKTIGVDAWGHTVIKIVPQGQRQYDNRYLFVMVGGSVGQGGLASNPAYHSSTNPEVHGICEGTSTNCRGYPNTLKLPNQYPTSGYDGSGDPLTFSLLATEANLDNANFPSWSQMRVSIGATTARPTTELITAAQAGVDCHQEDGTLLTAGCTRFTFKLPSSGWTGLNQPVTLWVATIKSNNALMDFQPPRITHIYRTGTTNPIEGVPTGGVAAGGAAGALRKFDIVGENFGAAEVGNSFELYFQNTADTNAQSALWIQPSNSPQHCDAYEHAILRGCQFPEGQGVNYVVTLKLFGHPTQTYPVDVSRLIDYIPPTLNRLTPTSGSTTGGYTVTITGINMGVAVSRAVLICCVDMLC
jgi:hypothetical protein